MLVSAGQQSESGIHKHISPLFWMCLPFRSSQSMLCSRFSLVIYFIHSKGHGSPLQCSCLKNPHGQRSLAGYSPRGHRVRHGWAQHRVQVYFSGDSAVRSPPDTARDLGSIPESVRSPGDGLATHPSILAWEIPWTEEPGRLQSTGSQKVGHDLATKQQKVYIRDIKF